MKDRPSAYDAASMPNRSKLERIQDMTDVLRDVVREMRAGAVGLLPDPAPEVIREWADRLEPCIPQPGNDADASAMDRPDYVELATQVGKLVKAKNAAYGDAFNRAGDILRVLYPQGISPEQYTDALAVVRVIDKLFRIATDRDALGESPWKDICGYGLLGFARAEQEQGGK